MNACARIGLDVTWRCNARCLQCFYRRNPKLGTPWDMPLPEFEAKVDEALRLGFGHVVLVGYGEPALWPHFLEAIGYAVQHGAAISAITNGTAPLTRYKDAYRAGLDHLHISMHEAGPRLDAIMQLPGAGERQGRLLEWLAETGKPYRVNVTMQRVNYERLPAVVDAALAGSPYHVVLLGFLPHYEWAEHVAEEAVHPAALREPLEHAAWRLLGSGTLFTIRYHPFCHLDERLWPYVVNARYCQFDPWEWNYLWTLDPAILWPYSVSLGDGVACTAPCGLCTAYRHCGGWNRVYAAAFSGAALSAILTAPQRYADVWSYDGGLHDLNPANTESGTILPAPAPAKP